MTFDDIRDFCCSKVGKVDDFSKGVCATFVKARHKEIYESFNWKAAQTLVEIDMAPLEDQETLDLPQLSHVTSLSINGQLLDPVSTSYIFESQGEDFSTPGTTPKFYDEFYSPTDQTPTIRFYPPLQATQPATLFQLRILGKLPLDVNATNIAIPNTENALIAFVLGDMWEYLHQVGKAQAKFTEAQALLQAAQTADTPPALKPRMTVALTATGNSLVELTDSVCNIIGKFDPNARVSVQERIRRNYQLLADAALWPDLTVIARVSITSNEQVILPHYFDRVVAVRTDFYADEIIRNQYQIKYRDVQLWFGLNPTVFEQSGLPVSYSLLPAIGTFRLPTGAERIGFQLVGPGGGGGRLLRHPRPNVFEDIKVFIKGLNHGEESYESVDVTTMPTAVPGPLHFDDFTYFSTGYYDTPITISKPITKGTLYVFAPGGHVELVRLQPNERERKHLRLWLKPWQQPDSSGTSIPSNQRLSSVLVLGKQKISQLVDDNDACQIRNAENVLINASAADMLFQLGQADVAAIFKQKAEANITALISAETQQAEYRPQILPYTETIGFDDPAALEAELKLGGFFVGGTSPESFDGIDGGVG